MATAFPFPTTIRQIGLNVAAGAAYNAMMKEFIDALSRDLKAKGAKSGQATLPIDPTIIADEPPRLDHPVHRVHLAAMAEHIAHLGGLKPPAWTERPDFFLSEAVYVGGDAARQTLLAETPCAFRRRLLFSGRALANLFKTLEQA